MSSKKMKYIKPNNLPPRTGVAWLVVWWLLLDRFAAPGWLYGVVFTLLGITYVMEVIRLFTWGSVDLVGNDD